MGNKKEKTWAYKKGKWCAYGRQRSKAPKRMPTTLSWVLIE